MASIFGLLDKRQRAADDKAFANDLDFSYEAAATGFRSISKDFSSRLDGF